MLCRKVVRDSYTGIIMPVLNNIYLMEVLLCSVKIVEIRWIRLQLFV